MPGVGVLACVIAVSGLVIAHQGREPDITAILSNSAKKLRQTLPVKVSDDLTLVHAYNEAAALVYVYEMASEGTGQTASQVVAGLRDVSIKRHCSDHHSAVLLERKVSWRYVIKAEG